MVVESACIQEIESGTDESVSVSLCNKNLQLNWNCLLRSTCDKDFRQQRACAVIGYNMLSNIGTLNFLCGLTQPILLATQYQRPEASDIAIQLSSSGLSVAA